MLVEPTTSEKPLDKATSTSQPHLRLSRPLQDSKAALLPRWTRRRWVKGSGRSLPSYIYLLGHVLPIHLFPLPPPGPGLSRSKDSHQTPCTRQLGPRGPAQRADRSSLPGPGTPLPAVRQGARTYVARASRARLGNGPPRDARLTLVTRGRPKRHRTPANPDESTSQP